MNQFQVILEDINSSCQSENVSYLKIIILCESSPEFNEVSEILTILLLISFFMQSNCLNLVTNSLSLNPTQHDENTFCHEHNLSTNETEMSNLGMSIYGLTA